MYSKEIQGIRLEMKPSSVSRRRRLQNRTAQRRFRERRDPNNRKDIRDNCFADWLLLPQWDAHDDDLRIVAERHVNTREIDSVFACSISPNGNGSWSSNMSPSPVLSDVTRDHAPITQYLSHHQHSPPTMPAIYLEGDQNFLHYSDEIDLTNFTMPISQNHIKAEYCGELPLPYASDEIKADRRHLLKDSELGMGSHGDILNGSPSYDGLFQPIFPEENCQNFAMSEYKIGNQTIDSQLLLHIAVHSQNCSMVATLLKHEAVGVEERDRYGRTALHMAVYLGNEALVSLLLQHGADIRSCDLYDQSPLYFAVVGGHNRILELLLQDERTKFIQRSRI